MSSQTTVDNAALFLGENNKVKITLEIAALGGDRTIPKGTFLTQKSGVGNKFVLHSAQLTSPIDGVLTDDLDVLDAGGDYNCSRAYDGHMDKRLLQVANGDIDIDAIPAGAALSYRVQCENKGIKVIDRVRL